MALDDYFFAFCISLPSKYPASPHNPTSAINASYDKVIIGKISFLNYGTITIYIDWACTPRLERTVLPFLVASVMILLLMEYFVKHMFIYNIRNTLFTMYSLLYYSSSSPVILIDTPFSDSRSIILTPFEYVRVITTKSSSLIISPETVVPSGYEIVIMCASTTLL